VPFSIRSKLMSEVRSKIRHLFVRYVSIMKRKKFIKNYLKQSDITKLQIGCGRNCLDGWLNTDYFPASKSVVFLDARKRLPFDDDTFDYIFCEHFLEHLTYQEGINMLGECFRILNRGIGKIRIATPDLAFLIDLYNKNRTDLQARYIRHMTDKFLPNSNFYESTFIINNFFYNWNHKFIYNLKVLSESMKKIGYANITKYNVGESDDCELFDLESHADGIYVTDEFNWLETLIVEGVKPNSEE